MTSLTKNGGSNESLLKRSRRPILCLAVLGIVLSLWIATPSPADPFEIEKFVPEMKTKNYEDNKVRHPAFWADCGVRYCLVTNRRNLVDWATEIRETEPKTVLEILIKINVLQHAGLDRQAAETVRLLKPFYPDPADPIAIRIGETLFGDAWDRFHAFHTALAICETFPSHASSTYNNQITRMFEQLGQMKGWSDAKREKWLIKMESEVPRELMFGKAQKPVYSHEILAPSHPGVIWTWLRFQMQDSDQKREAFLSQLKQDIEKHPENSRKAYYYVFFYGEILKEDKTRGDAELLWLAETAQPRRCQDAYALAKHLFRSHREKPTKIMLQKAKTLLEKAEQAPAASEASKVMTPEERKEYKLAIEDLQKKYDSYFGSAPPPVYVPAPPSSATAKNADNKKEKANKNDPGYWLRQAQDLCRALCQKNDEEHSKQAKHAFQKGLELTDPASWPAEPEKRKKCEELRGQIFASYMNFLEVLQLDYGEMGRACLRELKIAPPQSSSTWTAARTLCLDYVSPWVDWNDPVIWKWLEKRTCWSYTSFGGRYLEENLLDTIARELSKAPATFQPNGEASKAIYAFIENLEKLAVAKDADLACMKYCIKILSDPNTPLDIQPSYKRLIPLLKHWSQRKELYDYDRQYIGNQLVHAYLMENQIAEADAFIKSLKKDISQDRAMFLKIAQAAAEKGNKTIAMRNWRRSANYALKDKKQLELNRHLRQHGLGDQIDNYYNEVKKKLPRFVPVKEKKTQNHT